MPDLDVITIHTLNDVLLGRGKRYYLHQGNARFRTLIQERIGLYNAARASTKKQMTKEIVELIQNEYNGRFLKPTKAGWVKVDAETARLKVSHVFRTARAAAAGKKR